MATWSIGYAEKERIALEVRREGPPDCGYEWIAADVTVEVGGFRGRVSMSILLSEMIDFMETLKPVYHDLRGSAEFKTLEGQLYVKISVDKLGHVRASGYIIDRAGLGNKLEFVIEYDQTLLWHTISELDEAIDEIRAKSA